MSRGRPDPRETVRRQREVEARRRREGKDRDEAAGLHRSVPWWAEQVVRMKLLAVENTDRGDIPPVVISRRRGRDEAILVAPRVDKELGLEAAHGIRRAMGPDELILATDAHIFRGRSEGDFEEARKRWPNGLMQDACDLEGACATGEIMDCLLVCRADARGGLAMATVGYHYHVRGSTFRWDDAPIWTEERPGGARIGGYVADNLRAIMALPAIVDSPDMDEALRLCPGETRERGRYVMGVAAMSTLISRGFEAIDLLANTGPDYRPLVIDPDEIAREYAR